MGKIADWLQTHEGMTKASELLKEPVIKAAEFERAMQTVSDRMGVTDEELRKLQEAARQIGTKEVLGLDASDLEDHMIDLRERAWQAQQTTTPSGHTFITDIDWEWHTEFVDVTSFGDAQPTRVAGRQSVSFQDQNGNALPTDLELQLQKAAQAGELTGEKVTELINAFNNGSELTPHVTEEGYHPPQCSYIPPHRPCNCRMPSLCDDGLRWWCPCCRKARAMPPRGVCEGCQSHSHLMNGVSFQPGNARHAEDVYVEHLRLDLAEQGSRA